MSPRFARIPGAALVGVLLSVSAMGGQTVITAPHNKYTPAEDAELGQQVERTPTQSGQPAPDAPDARAPR